MSGVSDAQKHLIASLFEGRIVYLTADVDITPLYHRGKARGEKLYPALVWCVAAVLMMLSISFTMTLLALVETLNADKAVNAVFEALSRALANGLLSRGIQLVSGGSDNHLLLVDLRSTGITGKELEHRLDEVYITVNKNAIPNDPEKPFVTSGVRLGTPAVTTRGLDTGDMDKVAEYIALAATDFEANADKIREGVTAICKKHPLYE